MSVEVVGEGGGVAEKGWGGGGWGGGRGVGRRWRGGEEVEEGWGGGGRGVGGGVGWRGRKGGDEEEGWGGGGVGRIGRGGEEGHSASLTHGKPAATLEVICHTSLLDRRGDLPYCIISFSITSSLSILINAHSMLVINNPLIINDQIKSVSEIMISHYIINNYQ